MNWLILSFVSIYYILFNCGMILDKHAINRILHDFLGYHRHQLNCHILPNHATIEKCETLGKIGYQKIWFLKSC